MAKLLTASMPLQALHYMDVDLQTLSDELSTWNHDLNGARQNPGRSDCSVGQAKQDLEIEAPVAGTIPDGTGNSEIMFM